MFLCLQFKFFSIRATAIEITVVTFFFEKSGKDKHRSGGVSAKVESCNQGMES